MANINMQEPKVTDFAKWNDVYNYRNVLDSGVRGAITKVINAQNKPDGKFYEHVAGCNSVGLPIIGGYTYSYANTEEKAKKAADAFIEIGAPKGIKTMWLDLEDKSMMGLGHKIIDIINIYRKAAYDAGMKFGIYTGAQFYNPYLKPYAKEIAGIPIWWARYPFTKEYKITTDVPDSKYLPTGMEITGWQYTSKGVIPGINGYVDLSIFFNKEAFENVSREISVEYNPFTEPTANVALGKTGNDASWVQWYLWRFGKLTDGMGQADATKINGLFEEDTKRQVMEVQALLGLDPDGIVGKITRATWKKIC